MLQRIITGAWALAILVLVLIFSHTVAFPIAIAFISVVSVLEMLRCMGLHKKYALSLPLYCVAAAAPFLVRYVETLQAVLILTIVGVVYALYLFVLVIWSHGTLKFDKAGTAYFVILYILTALNLIIYIRDFDGIGKYIYLLIFIGAWVTDTFAYFTGMLFGKHKLIEDVSPKKTIEGSIGGMVFCVISFVVFGLIVSKDANLLFLGICGLLISVISQIGDLILSVVKRAYRIKDYGKLFPGHGGMLDRFDSILAVSLGLAAVCMFVTLTGVTIL